MSQPAIEFLQALGLKARATGPHQTAPRPTPTLWLATVASNYSGSGAPAVVFDGESAATTLLLPYLSSYTPAANDRVLVASIGHSYVILGKILT